VKVEEGHKYLLGSEIEAGSEFEVISVAGTILWVGTGTYLIAGQ
jgi:hypothetical protein